MNKELSQDSLTIGTIDEYEKKFSSTTNCIKVQNPVPPRGNMVCLIENLSETVPIYRPDSCMFIKTDEPCAVGVMMRITSELWIIIKKDRSTKQRERLDHFR